jgi:hypothetical protein
MRKFLQIISIVFILPHLSFGQMDVINECSTDTLDNSYFVNRYFPIANYFRIKNCSDCRNLIIKSNLPSEIKQFPNDSCLFYLNNFDTVDIKLIIQSNKKKIEKNFKVIYIVFSEGKAIISKTKETKLTVGQIINKPFIDIIFYKTNYIMQDVACWYDLDVLESNKKLKKTFAIHHLTKKITPEILEFIKILKKGDILIFHNIKYTTPDSTFVSVDDIKIEIK